MALDVTAPVAASGSLTLADELDDQDSIRVGNRVYVVAATPDAANEIDIGTNATTTASNIEKAINGTGTAGVEYYTGTLPVTGVTASAAAGVITVEADLPGDHGNSFALDGAVAGTDVTAVAFQGGAGGVEEILENIIDLNQVNGEVVAEIRRFTERRTAAALPE